MSIKNEQIANLRKDYNRHKLSIDEVDSDPFRQFDTWFKAAQSGGVVEPNIMTLATVGHDGMPSARILLLKGYNHDGFLFYSNYQSRKGQQMHENPKVRTRLPLGGTGTTNTHRGTSGTPFPEQSDRYYQSRPRGSRIGAWASPQSRSTTKQALDQAVLLANERFGADGDIPRPPFWGGYRVIPERIEFWQGRPSRLHDRICYTRMDKAVDWTLERLAP